MSAKLSHSYSSIKMFENCALQYYYVRVAKVAVNKGGEATIWGERVHKQLEDRLEHNVGLPPESSAHEPAVVALEKLTGSGTLFVEREATLNKDLQPTGWWDHDAWLRSKLDVLILRGPTAYVFDWKTGKRRPDFSQLELFALQVFTHEPAVQVVHSKFLWLKDGVTDHEKYTRDMMPVMWEKLLGRIKRIEQAAAANVWPARPSGLCSYCPARHLCEFAR